MKQLLTLATVLITSTYAHTTLTYNKKIDTFLQATRQFKMMKVAQIKNLNIHSLSPEELSAFKTLAKSIFNQEIASADCFSQANRRKYEVMYQKIGEFDASQHTL
jgi:predicted phosphoadenosine phosphosulfate sulfurtransferase